MSEIVDVFFDKYSNETEEKKGVYSNWSQINKDGLPYNLHYEFHCVKSDGVNIAFHIEDDKYKKLKDVIKVFENKQINKSKIKFDPHWFKGKKREGGLGRIYIQFGHEYFPEDVAKMMRMFIDETYEKIEKSIKEIQDEKK